MLTFFKSTLPTRLLLLLLLVLALRLPLLWWGLPLMPIELRAMLVGERLGEGVRLYRDLYDSTAPLAAALAEAVSAAQPVYEGQPAAIEIGGEGGAQPPVDPDPLAAALAEAMGGSVTAPPATGQPAPADLPREDLVPATAPPVVRAVPAPAPVSAGPIRAGGTGANSPQPAEEQSGGGQDGADGTGSSTAPPRSAGSTVSSSDGPTPAEAAARSEAAAAAQDQPAPADLGDAPPATETDELSAALAAAGLKQTP